MRESITQLISQLITSAAGLRWLVGLLVLIGPCHTSLAQSGLNAPASIAAYLNGAFPSVEPSVDDDQVTGYSQRNYYPELSFVEPLRVVEHPVENALLVVGKDGLGHLVTNVEGATDKRVFFDIRPIMHGNPGFGEGGISDLVFHPRFALGTQDVFISYWWSPVNSGTFSNDNGIDGYNRVSRFAVVDNAVDLASEQVLINQYDREFWHIGMDMQFGNDGLLYIAMGDETPTTCCALADSTQRLDGGLWSGIIRIDIDSDPDNSHPIRRQPQHPTVDPTANGSAWPASYTQGYYIPNDNPFLEADGSVLEEFYSLGLRHPWTMSIDEANGDVWAADVGKFSREEINLIRKGDNHQWPFREGELPGPGSVPPTVFGVERAPEWHYDHTVGTAIIGAGVYRGERFPELVGKYLFSDFRNGPLWAASPSGTGYSVEQIGNVSAGWFNGISSYLFDSRGQILMARSGGAQEPDGRVDVLVRVTDGDGGSEAPDLLSATGAFSDLNAMTVVDGCVPYDLNVPFWSDGAEKYRWVCVPNDGSHDSASETVLFSEDGPWAFPIGTVFIKHFEIDSVEGDPSSALKLETRFTVIGEDDTYGLSYRWNEAGTDARLARSSGEIRLFVQDTAGEVALREWEYPSRSDCQTCHDGPAGAALGLTTRQLNRSYTYPLTGLNANQLETLNHLGMFTTDIDAVQVSNTALTLAASDDTSASLELRARSYLDSNCGYCHQPGGVRGQFDARFATPLDEQGLIDGELLEDYGITGEAVIVPGRSDQSIAHVRLGSLGMLAMPPLLKSELDEDGLQLVDQWIASLETEPSILPAIVSPLPDTILAGAVETFEWTNNDFNVDQWWLYVGSSVGGREYHNSGNLGTATTHQVSGLPVDGSLVHVRLWYLPVSGQWESVDAQFTAIDSPLVTPAIVSPAPNSTLAGSDETFEWTNNDIDVDQWWLYVGSSIGARDYHNSGNLDTATTQPVSRLPRDGSVVHARLWYLQTDGQWEFVDAQFTAIDNPLPAPSIVSPAPNSILAGNAETFTWASNATGADTEVDQWWLYAGSSVGGNQYYDSGDLGLATTKLVSGLPIDGGDVHVRLWYFRDALWSFVDHVYEAAQAGPSLLPASDTTLGSSATFSWQSNGPSVADWWVYVGTAPGARDLLDSGLLAASQLNITATGWQPGDDVHVRLWYRFATETWRYLDRSYSSE